MPSVFCDWLSIHQTHFSKELPRLNNGAVFCVNADGEVEWTTEAKFEHVGSYDTKIRIKCDGSRVVLEGNVGRFGRRDNVFGYSVIDCIHRANAILERFGLPPFTEAEFDYSAGRLANGATITRVDLTANYSTGNIQNAVKLVHYLGGQEIGRKSSTMQYGDSGVTWNEGSKYQSSKLYVKAASIGEHASPEVVNWVKQQGIVRHEITLKSRYLAQQQLQHIQNWKAHRNGKETDMAKIIYNRFTDVLERGTAVTTDIDHIPGRIGCLASAWRAGKDLWGDESVGKSTRRRWRKELLPYGIDIKKQSTLARINTRVKVIEMQPAQAPAWYWNEQARAA